MSAKGSSVKGSIQQSWSSGSKVKGRGLLFLGEGPLIPGGGRLCTTPMLKLSVKQSELLLRFKSRIQS